MTNPNNDEISFPHNKLINREVVIATLGDQATFTEANMTDYDLHVTSVHIVSPVQHIIKKRQRKRDYILI